MIPVSYVIEAKRVDDLWLATTVLMMLVAVLRWKMRGVFIGAMIGWIMLILAGMMLSAADPDRGFNLDGLWILIGWAPSLILCLVIYLIMRATVWARKPKRN